MTNYTRRLTTTWTDGQSPISKSVNPTGDSVDGRLIDVPSGMIVEIDLTFKRADLQGIIVLTDVPVNMFTNHITGSGDEFALAANSPFSWYAGSGIPNPFTQDVTTVFFESSPTQEEATVILEIIYNQT